MVERLTVIVPCYNEEDGVVPFYERAKPALESLGLDWELLFVNDGSTDGSLDKILGLRKNDPRIKVLTLSRNFGYHAGLIAGLSSRDSSLYAIVDVDCEDPPELLPKFLKEIRSGAQIAYGNRSKRDEPAWVVFFRWLFYIINRRIADSPIQVWMGEFTMFRREVRDATLKNRTTAPFLRAELGHVGFKKAGVAYYRETRRYGRTHYNLPSMVRFAMTGFLSSSTFPLRGTLYFSAALVAGYVAAVACLRPSLVEAAALSAIFTFALAAWSFPVTALYLARTYKDVSGRPVFYADPARSHLD